MSLQVQYPPRHDPDTNFLIKFVSNPWPQKRCYVPLPQHLFTWSVGDHPSWLPVFTAAPYDQRLILSELLITLGYPFSPHAPLSFCIPHSTFRFPSSLCESLLLPFKLFCPLRAVLTSGTEPCLTSIRIRPLFSDIVLFLRGPVQSCQTLIRFFPSFYLTPVTTDPSVFLLCLAIWTPRSSSLLRSLLTTILIPSPLLDTPLSSFVRPVSPPPFSPFQLQEPCSWSLAYLHAASSPHRPSVPSVFLLARFFRIPSALSPSFFDPPLPYFSSVNSMQPTGADCLQITAYFMLPFLDPGPCSITGPETPLFFLFEGIIPP